MGDVDVNRPQKLLLLRKRYKMRYLLLIYQDEVAHAQWNEQQLEEEYEPTMPWDRIPKHAVEMQGGEALMPTNTATTVRVRDW